MGARNIKLFLVDGSPTGVIIAEIGQWTGRAAISSRAHLKGLASRKEVQKPGVYILAGPDPEKEGRERIYIGEGERAFDRIRSHDQQKDFWTRVCIFTGDANLTKAHIKYLESRLVEIANGAGRAVVDNGNTPPRPTLPESDAADMETFLEQVCILLPVVGFSFAQPAATAKVIDHSQSPSFVISGRGASATGRQIDDEFVVLKGSKACREGVPSWTCGVATRARILKEGVLIESSDLSLYEFSKDHAFSSPSLAASVVLARNTNGRTAWKIDVSGETYAEWQEAALNSA